MSMERVAVVGADLYCPDCRRLLISFNGDGTMNVAGMTTFRTVAEITIDEFGNEVFPEDCVVSEAICLKRSCRLKRWRRNLRKKGPE